MTAVRNMAVIMPVHNEEEHLERAVGGVEAAVASLQRLQPETTVRVLVVLDSCIDSSAAMAAHFTARFSWFSALAVSFRSVGRSRRAGIREVLRPAADTPGAAAGWWLANTDADSLVPPDWLVSQAAMAAAGADAVLGSVDIDPVGAAPDLVRRWQLRHPFQEDHPHIYGANFGIRGSAYLAAGGFPRHRSHEDRVLAERLRRMGFNVKATDTIRVLTSGRTHARAPQGLGGYLRALSLEASLAPET
ncbi:Glycosyl transferase [Arthrobacter sp. 9AX]|uniref:glycosyltransferase n=1 Tax=Arthrobacter sp. 9AX TaxID=2653131 RepID=UPI0012F35EE8|nr:glycosyltransferase [Arthrobacter sp. 9AX]VXB94143.1 Glycosyl transferase [Arthrobacter sp. 9AX]